MRKILIAKAALCCGAVIAGIAISNMPKATSATLSTETGLAGISVTLDKYCEATVEKKDTVTIGDVIVPSGSITTAEHLNDVTENEKTSEENQPTESKYANTGISIAEEYVNIRKGTSTESEIVGKLYRGSAANIIEKKGEWVKIESGKCKGYINAQYLAIGYSAEQLEDQFATKYATVNTETLRVRKKKSTEADCVTLVPQGETYEILKDSDEWVKVAIDEDTKGYVSKDYVEIKAEFEKAVSIEEEQEALRKEEEARRLEEEAARQLEAEQQAQTAVQQETVVTKSPVSDQTTVKSTNNSVAKPTAKPTVKPTSKPTEKPVSETKEDTSSSQSSTGSAKGSNIADYALTFVGRCPYVYGGTSLTSGVDCSGFTMRVFEKFGISLPRTSREQARVGSSVSSLSQARVGDLICYADSSGVVGHVAIYIGGGRVVHASTKKTGIKTSVANYRSIYTIRRVLK